MTTGTRVFEFKNQGARKGRVMGIHVGHSALAVSVIETENEAKLPEGKDPVVAKKPNKVPGRAPNGNSCHCRDSFRDKTAYKRCRMPDRGAEEKLGRCEPYRIGLRPQLRPRNSSA